MELLHGKTLAEQLKERGRLGMEESLFVVQQMASALGAAHAAGIVHRDFKPGNVVLVSSTGQQRERVVVTDFGLALRSVTSDETASLPTGQNLLGTPAYMSPEQLEGKPATAESDIYALGLVIYEMVTGARPFQGDTPISAAAKRLSQAAPPPRRFEATLSPVWERTILRCLERDPAKRFGSVLDVSEALTGGKVAVSRHRRNRNRIAWGAAGGLALILAMVAAFGYRNHWALFAHNGPQIKSRRSVAVLGFKNLTGKAEEGWLSTAISEMLTTELAAGGKLLTIPGENVAQMKASLSLGDEDSYGSETLAKIRKALGTEEVVLGSYLALGNGTVRLDLKLEDTNSGQIVDSISENGTETEISNLVSLAGNSLRSKLGAGEITSAEADEVKASLPSDPEAARTYAEGLAKLRSYDVLAARDLLVKSVNADPNYALAHSALAAAWSQLGYQSRARQEAQKAFDLSGPLSREERMAVEARLRQSTREWSKAAQLYQSLFGFFPDNLEYGLDLVSMQVAGGQAGQALATLDQLRKLPPPRGSDPRIDLSEARAAVNVGDFKRQKLAAERAAQAGRANGNLNVLARALSAQGSALYQLGELKESKAVYEQARPIYEKVGDKAQVATNYSDIGQVLADEGEWKAAQTMFDRSTSIWREMGNQGGVAYVLNEAGILLRHKGELEQAMNMFQQSYAVKQEIDDKSGMIAALGNEANIQEDMGDLVGSEKSHEEGLALARAIGNKRFEAIAMGNIANAEYEQGRTSEAIDGFHKALALSQEIGNKFASLYQMHTLAGVLTQTGDLSAARELANGAIQSARESNQKEETAEALTVLGAISFEGGDFSAARKSYEQALALWHELSGKNSEAQIWFLLAQVDLEEARLTDAETRARNSVNEYRSEKARDMEVDASSILVPILLAAGKPAEAQQYATRAWEIIQKSQNQSIRIPMEIAKATVDAQTGRVSGAVAELNHALTAARAAGYLRCEFEARLALGEIKLKSGNAAVARGELAKLEKDATAKGFLRIARKAAAAAKT
jgi:tetratricopeptide (TPR) repeat protein